MQKNISHSLEETNKIAEEWLKKVSKKYEQTGKALIVGLSGHLGAGKTAFVKEVAKILGVQETVTSPTFVIMKIYDIGKPENFDKWKKLVHIDLYRLEKAEELKALNLEKVMADKSNLVMVEWPENVGLEIDTAIAFKALEEAGAFEIDY